MSVPGIVESALDDEAVAAQVPLSGGDEAFVTPTRTLVYRAEGLLSDESVDEYPHDVDRVSVAQGRRKTKVVLEYPDGDRSIAVPEGRLHAVLEPLVAGVLRTRNVTAPDERIAGAFRFSELTLVVTSERLLKNVGEAVWDDSYEAYHFEDVTGLEYEEGSVATQIVLTVDGRKQRIKTPNDRTPQVREGLESALRAYHNVTDLADLSGGTDEADPGDSVVELDDDIDPLTTEGGTAGDGASGDDPDATDAGGGAAAGGPDAAVADAGAAEPDPADGGEAVGAAAGGSAAEGDTGTGDAGPTTGAGDTGPTAVDAGSGSAPDAGSEPGPDAGTDAGPDAGTDAGPDAGADSGSDAGTDSDPDPGTGSGPEPGSGDGTGEPGASSEDATDGADEDDGFPFTETIEPVDDDPELREEIDELRAAIERQNELLAEQQRTLETLVEELRDEG